MQCPHCFKSDSDDMPTRCPHCSGEVGTVLRRSEQSNASEAVDVPRTAIAAILGLVLSVVGFLIFKNQCDEFGNTRSHEIGIMIPLVMFIAGVIAFNLGSLFWLADSLAGTHGVAIHRIRRK